MREKTIKNNLMNTLVSNALELVRMQYKIDALSSYLINCPINAVDFDAKFIELKTRKTQLESFKQSLNS